jgi:hypothetical protein
MKLYVAGVDARGRSYLESETELPVERVVHVWRGTTSDVARTISGMVPDARLAATEPDPHGFQWIFNRIPPIAEAEKHGYRTVGKHATRTIDFDFVLDGHLACKFDEGEVELRGGDFIILKAANHEWVNLGDGMATMLVMLHRPAESEGQS